MKTLQNQVVVIDASPGGVSGDKYLGALLDLGADLESLRKVARTVSENFSGADKVVVKVGKVERGEIEARHVAIESEKKPTKRKGMQVLRVAEKCVAKLGLSDWGS